MLKNRPYLFFNSMANIKNFDSSLLSIDQILFKKNNVLFMILNISKILRVLILFILFLTMQMHTLNEIPPKKKMKMNTFPLQTRTKNH